MDHVANKVGSYWLGQKADKQFNSVTNDIDALSDKLEGGTKWLVNKVKGKMQKPLPEFLKEFGLPIGIFPRDATNYEFNEQTKKLTVFIPLVCEVNYKDGSVLRFNTKVTAFLEIGKLTDIEGMKTKVVLIWIRVSAISADGPMLQVTSGITRSRNRNAYEARRDGLLVDNF